VERLVRRTGGVRGGDSVIRRREDAARGCGREGAARPARERTSSCGGAFRKEGREREREREREKERERE